MIAPFASNLRAFIEHYAMLRGLSPNSARALRYTANSFDRFLGREARIADLSDDRLNAWSSYELAAGLDPETVRGRRTALVGIWKEANDCGLTTAFPRKLRKIKVPEKIPVCWDLQSELAKLLAVARLLEGTMHRDPRIDRRDFWQGWIHVDYGVGLRLADLLALRFSNIAPDGAVVFVQMKTGHIVRGQISREGMYFVERLRKPSRKLVFGGLMNHWNAQRYFRKLVRLAGLNGSTKWLRRTGATWCEVENPGSAQHYLGHKTAGLAWRCYIDRRFVERHKPSPPPIG